MKDFIFEPIKKKKIEPVIEYYCMGKDQDFTDDNNYARANEFSSKVYAQKTQTSDGTQYAVKINNNHKLYNPLDFGLEDRSSSILDNVIRPESKMKNVNQTTFELYVKFLNTKNMSFLIQAEREMV
jgi:hypothetical protein